MSDLSRTVRNLFGWFGGTKPAPVPTTPTPSPVKPVPHQEAPLDFAGKIIKAMKAHNCVVTEKDDEVNIVYIDGVNRDGTKNKNDPNAFDDARLLISFRAGKPVIIGAWEAVTSTAKYYTEHRINSKGAARIAWGQQTAWQVGMHHGKQEALVQTGGKVSVYRDDDEDYSREGDDLDTGWFGINQHGGYDFPHNDVKTASAGCLVGRMVDGHEDFMRLVKTDARYRKDHKYVFSTTVMPVDWLEGVSAASSKNYTYTLDRENSPFSEYVNDDGTLTWMARMGAETNEDFRKLPDPLKKELLNGVPVLEAVEHYHKGLSPVEQVKFIELAKPVGVIIK